MSRALLGRIADLGQDFVARRLHPVDPFVAAGRGRLGGGEVRAVDPRSTTSSSSDLIPARESSPMGPSLRGVVAEVLELAGRRVGLQGFRKVLVSSSLARSFLTSSSASRLRLQKNRPFRTLLHEHQPLHRSAVIALCSC